MIKINFKFDIIIGIIFLTLSIVNVYLSIQHPVTDLIDILILIISGIIIGLSIILILLKLL